MKVAVHFRYAASVPLGRGTPVRPCGGLGAVGPAREGKKEKRKGAGQA